MQLWEFEGIKAVCVKDSDVYWKQIEDTAPYVPCEYLQTSVEYEAAYIKENYDNVEILNSVLFAGDKPVGIWPLNLRERDGLWTLGSNAGRVLPPLLGPSLSAKRRKAVYRSALQQLEVLCKFREIDSWSGYEMLYKPSTSEWHRAIMNRGATLSAQHEIFIDLEKSFAEIKSQFRKSYKALVSKSHRLLNYRCSSLCYWA